MLNSLSQKDIRVLIKRIIITNIVFIGVAFALNIFIDFEELHKELPFSAVLEYQTVAVIILFLLEVLILTIVVSQWFRSRRIDINSLNKLISEGENENTEFKASLRWDYKENRK